MRYIGVALVPIIALLLLYVHPLNVYLLGFFFMGFVGLVLFFAYRSIHSGEGGKIDQQSRENSLLGYSLYCRNCGYTWEMTIEEWETAGRIEKEDFVNFPSRFPSNKGSLNEALERIEWKPPNPSRGFFIVTAFIGAGLLASLSAYAVIWAKTHPDNSYAPLANGVAAIVALLVYTGLVLVFKLKANKIVLILLILVTVIGLVLAVLRLLLA